jgi:hypothetical protein
MGRAVQTPLVRICMFCFAQNIFLLFMLLSGLYFRVLTWTILTSASLAIMKVRIYIWNSRTIQLNFCYDQTMANRQPTTWLKIQTSRSQFWLHKRWRYAEKPTLTLARLLLHRGQTTKSTILQFIITVISTTACKPRNICRTISIRF